MHSKRFIRGVVIMGIVLLVIVGLPMTLVVVASAPWDTVPTDAEAVGVWQVGNTSQRVTLYPSHRMTFSNLPKGVAEGHGGNRDGSTPRISGTGTWTAFSNDGYGPASGYTLNGTGDQGNSLYSKWFGSARELVIYDFPYAKPIELDFHRVSATP